MKIVIDRNIPYIQGLLEPYADVVYLPDDEICNASLIDVDALLVRTRTRCNETLLNGTSVRFIGTATIGTDHIDLDYCKQHNIVVANAAGCNAGAVMQYVVSSLLLLSQRNKKPLEEMILGVVGVGNVGSLIVKAAGALGMKTLLNDPPRAAREGNSNFVTLNEVLEKADVVSLHVPLTVDTRDMANDAFFQKIKTGSWFINTSRGEVINENSLIKYRKKLGSVVLDVWSHEPEINEQLLSIADIATPHIAGYSRQGKTNATKMVTSALVHFMGYPQLLNLELNKAFTPKTLTLHEEDSLLSVIHNIYNIMDDDARLRKNVAAFEKVRNEYVLRDEFNNYRIEGKANKSLSSKLQVLGFSDA